MHSGNRGNVSKRKRRREMRLDKLQSSANRRTALYSPMTPQTRFTQRKQVGYNRFQLDVEVGAIGRPLWQGEHPPRVDARCARDPQP
jgi:hypothetical protein